MLLSRIRQSSNELKPKNTIGRNMKRSITLRLATLLSVWGASNLSAQHGSYLEPVEGYFHSLPFTHPYLSAVREILIRDSFRAPAAMVTLPSFAPESMVSIESRDGKVYIVHATASEPIWSSKKREGISVLRRENIVDLKVAQRIHEAFALATSRIRYPEEPLAAVDGVSYYFSALTAGGMRAGCIWDPAEQSRCAMLVDLGKALSRFATGQESEDNLRNRADAVLVAFNKILL
jgi:hypothetical protein